MFHVEKSENQNQVHYAIRLDAACRPVGKTPVFAYWKRYKSGKRVDEPLVGMGTRVYGASDTQKVKAGATGGEVEMYVKALDRVRIRIQIEKNAQGCQATPITLIKGHPSRLSHGYLELRRFNLGVKYVDLIGYRVSDGAKVTQRYD